MFQLLLGGVTILKKINVEISLANVYKVDYDSLKYFSFGVIKKKRLGLDEGLAIVLRTTDYLSPRGGEGVGFFRGGGTEKGLATSLTEYKVEL